VESIVKATIADRQRQEMLDAASYNQKV